MSSLSHSFQRPGRKAFLAFLSGALLFSACAGSKSRLKMGETAEGEVVEAVGLAPNNPSDKIATKRASLLDAQRNAIEKAVGVFVSGRTLVEKAIAIENNILSKSDGYIKKFDVLKEWVEDDLYHTRIRALVALREIESDLRELDLIQIPVLERPRVFMSLTEKVGRKNAATPAASIAFEKSLQDQGFVVVDEGDAKTADLVFKGKAAALPFQKDGLGGFVSYRATLHGQVSRPGSQNVMLSFAKEASGLGGNAELAGIKALQTVGELAGQEVGEEVARKWSEGSSLIFQVEGCENFDQVDAIKKRLSAQPGVDSMILRFFDEGTASFEARLKNAKPQEIASQISKAKDFPARVVETSGQTIRLKHK